MTVLDDIKEIIANRNIMESFSNKTILVTGASGLIGSMLVKTLYYANKEYNLNIIIIGHARNETRTKKILGDIANEIIIIYSEDFNVKTKCDYIFHTACPTSSKYFVEHPVETIDTIIYGTKKMLELAKDNKATFVYLSSMEEYGVPYEINEIMTEDKIGIVNHMTPRGCYPEGKRMCECMCLAYTTEYGIDTKIVRLAQTFGSGIPLTDNRVSMQFAKSVCEKKNIVLHTDGKSVSNYCYLSDSITGILIAAVRGESGEAYNICNDAETRTIKDIALLVAEKVANGTIKVEKDINEQMINAYAPDNTMRLCSDKLCQLGWKPKVDMVEGYRRLISYISCL